MNNPRDPWLTSDDDNRGTSTSDDEAILRDIGRDAFGIRYPKDITPRKRNLPLPSRPLKRLTP